MTRNLLGFALAVLCLFPLGAGLLLLAGAWSQLAGVLRLGVSLFVAMAAAMVVLPPLLYAGLSPSLPIVVLAGTVVLGTGLALKLHRRVQVQPLRLDTRPALALSVPLILLAVQGADKPVDRYDAFANWTLKAKLLLAGGTLTGALEHAGFSTPSIAPPVSRQYPIGLPALDAYFLRVIGDANVRVAHLLFVVFLAGFAFTLWAILRREVQQWPLVLGLSFLLWMPALRNQVLSDYADVPLACLSVAAVLSMGVWIAEERTGWLWLGTLFAAAALATKRDAVTFCVVLYGVAFAALVMRGSRSRPRGFRLLGVSAGLAALSVLPWRLFVAVNGLEDHDVNLSLSRALGHANELPFIIRRFAHFALDSAYFGALPLAVLASLALLSRPRHRQVAFGVIALLVGLLAALAFVYLNGVASVHYLVRTSTGRTLMTPTLLAAALLPLLLSRLLETSPADNMPRDVREQSVLGAETPAGGA